MLGGKGGPQLCNKPTITYKVQNQNQGQTSGTRSLFFQKLYTSIGRYAQYMSFILLELYIITSRYAQYMPAILLELYTQYTSVILLELYTITSQYTQYMPATLQELYAQYMSVILLELYTITAGTLNICQLLFKNCTLNICQSFFQNCTQLQPVRSIYVSYSSKILQNTRWITSCNPSAIYIQLAIVQKPALVNILTDKALGHGKEQRL